MKKRKLDNLNYYDFFPINNPEKGNYLGYFNATSPEPYVLGCNLLPKNGIIDIYIPDFLLNAQKRPLTAIAQNDSIKGAFLRIINNLPNYHYNQNKIHKSICIYHPLAITEITDVIDFAEQDLLDLNYLHTLLQLIEKNSVLKHKDNYLKVYNYLKKKFSTENRENLKPNL